MNQTRQELAHEAITRHVLPALHTATSEAGTVAVLTELVCLLMQDSTADFAHDFSVALPGDLEPGNVAEFFSERREHATFTNEDD